MLIKAENLKKYYSITKATFSARSKEIVKAVDNVSFEIRKGEILGLVGESGCGKTTLGKLLLRLVEPGGGKLSYQGEEIFSLPAKRLRGMRRKIQIIFQDPYKSLNPRMRISEIISEPLFVHNLFKNREKERVKELLKLVGLPLASMNNFPHQFSGGQRQRVNIARALATNPEFIVCDEPVSNLDVSISAQILNLLKKLQEEFNLTYLFISHDLSVVGYFCDRIMVMKKGKIIEVNSAEELYDAPSHPYTKALLSSIPKIQKISPAKQSQALQKMRYIGNTPGFFKCGRIERKK